MNLVWVSESSQLLKYFTLAALYIYTKTKHHRLTWSNQGYRPFPTLVALRFHVQVLLADHNDVPILTYREFVPWHKYTCWDDSICIQTFYPCFCSTCVQLDTSCIQAYYMVHTTCCILHGGSCYHQFALTLVMIYTFQAIFTNSGYNLQPNRKACPIKVYVHCII